ncbi:MAG: uroporphyrinogen decarboxylase family protein [Promethearchaeota archaeon]
MNARERVLKAFEHEVPDRVPTFLQSMMPNFVDQCMELYEDEVEEDDILYFGKDFTMYVKLGFDMGWGASCFTTRPDPEVLKANPLPVLGPNRTVNLTGRITEHGTLLGHGQSWVAGSVLEGVEQAVEWYETYVKPSVVPVPNAVEQINGMLRSAGNYHDKFVPVAGMPAILEPLMEGLGMGLFARFMRKHRSKLKEFAGWLARDAVEHAKLAVETDYEVFVIADDSAYKNSTMISPEDHRDVVVPCYKQVCDVVRRAGKFIFFHSDGYTEPYFPGLVEAGFHGVESLEPMAGMDLAHLKEEYGDRLCLIGNVDVSHTLPLGTPEDVAAEVRRCVDAAAAGGGYILSPCTDLTDAVPVENAVAMVEAVKKYGVYP